MVSHVSNAILSLTRLEFVDEEGVYRIEVEMKDGKLVFLKEKALSFHTKGWLQYIHTSSIFRVCSTLI